MGLAVVDALDGGVAAGPQGGLALGTLEARLVEDLALHRQPLARVHCQTSECLLLFIII